MKRCLSVALLFVVSAANAQWKYGSDKDSMTDEVTKWATLTSPTRVNLGFPYQGGTVGTLTVGKEDVIVRISRGQLIHGDDVDVRFDDDPVMRFGTVGAASGSSTVAFVKFPGFVPGPGSRDVKREEFNSRLRTAKRIRVQMSLYQAGAIVFEFRPAGLKAEGLSLE